MSRAITHFAATRWWILVLFGGFALFALPALLADLWYDEVITLGDYVLDGTTPSSLHRIFTCYPAPNNHVLFSAILWAWVRLVPCVVEPVLRLPSLAFALTTVLWMAFAWRRWLGAGTACFAAMVMTASPVYLHFAVDLRGYGLSILLATLAVSGTLAILEGRHPGRGHLLCGVSSFLLPLVMPTNALLPIALLLFMAGTRLRARMPLTKILLDGLPTGGALLLGCSYYLLIWNQFTAALGRHLGFASPWPVAEELAGGFTAHLLPAMLLLAVTAFWRFCPPAIGCPMPATATKRSVASGALLAMTGVTVIALVLGLVRPVPYSRVFLPFLPVFTLAAGLCLRRRLNLDCFPRLQLAAMGLAVGLGGTGLFASNAFTTSELARGNYPQSLLCQYYYGDHSVSATVFAILEKHPPATLSLLVPESDLPAFRYYWTVLTGRDATDIYPQSHPPPPGRAAILVVNGAGMTGASPAGGRQTWPAAGTVGRFTLCVPPAKP